jgi:hypothetical protein
MGLRFVRRDTLVTVIAVTIHHEISNEFTFCEEQSCWFGKLVFSRSHETRAFLIYETHRRNAGLTIATSAQLRFYQEARESAFDLGRGLSFRNGKPYKSAACRWTLAKPEHK